MTPKNPTAEQRRALAEIGRAVRELSPERREAFGAIPDQVLEAMTKPERKPSPVQRRAALRALLIAGDPASKPALRSLQSKLSEQGIKATERTIAADLAHLREQGKLPPIREKALPRSLVEDETVAAIGLDEVTMAFGVSVRTLQRYIARGELKASKVGRRYLVTVASLRAWLELRASRDRESA